jgi:hypothetical protein
MVADVKAGEATEVQHLIITAHATCIPIADAGTGDAGKPDGSGDGAADHGGGSGTGGMVGGSGGIIVGTGSGGIIAGGSGGKPATGGISGGSGGIPGGSGGRGTGGFGSGGFGSGGFFGSGGRGSGGVFGSGGVIGPPGSGGFGGFSVATGGGIGIAGALMFNTGGTACTCADPNQVCNPSSGLCECSQKPADACGTRTCGDVYNICNELVHCGDCAVGFCCSGAKCTLLGGPIPIVCDVNPGT